MQKIFKKSFIMSLWEKFQTETTQTKFLEKKLYQLGIEQLKLDHFAIIDLPGPKSGIPYLKEIFLNVGFEQRGEGYLPAKQNDFIWMKDIGNDEDLAQDTLPQAVLADFRLDEMPSNIQTIILKYSQQTESFNRAVIQNLVRSKDFEALQTYLLSYFGGRDWPMPTIKEFQHVQEFNELLAWVLVFGRQVNHFSIATHLLFKKNTSQPYFKNLTELRNILNQDTPFSLNQDGKIQGNHKNKLEQFSSRGENRIIQSADKPIHIPFAFLEFVWRHANVAQPSLCKDYFSGFFSNQADEIIESLYQDSHAEKLTQ